MSYARGLGIAIPAHRGLRVRRGYARGLGQGDVAAVGEPLGRDPRSVPASGGGRLVPTMWLQRGLNATGRYLLAVDNNAGSSDASQTMAAALAYNARLGNPTPRPQRTDQRDHVVISDAMERMLGGLRRVADPRGSTQTGWLTPTEAGTTQTMPTRPTTPTPTSVPAPMPDVLPTETDEGWFSASNIWPWALGAVVLAGAGVWFMWDKPIRVSANTRKRRKRTTKPRTKRRSLVPIGPGRPGQSFSMGDTQITTTLHEIYPVRKNGVVQFRIDGGFDRQRARQHVKRGLHSGPAHAHFHQGERVDYQGVDMIVYDFDAHDRGILLTLVRPDFSGGVQGVSPHLVRRARSRKRVLRNAPRGIPRVGTRVVFTPTPASLALYSESPDIGEKGTVATVPLPGGRSHYLRGPGGGLVYVSWDRSRFQGVSPIDLSRAKKHPSLKKNTRTRAGARSYAKSLTASGGELERALTGTDLQKYEHLRDELIHLHGYEEFRRMQGKVFKRIGNASNYSQGRA